MIISINSHLNIVSIIVLNIEARQYNIKLNLAISCIPTNLSFTKFLRYDR